MVLLPPPSDHKRIGEEIRVRTTAHGRHAPAPCSMPMPGEGCVSWCSSPLEGVKARGIDYRGVIYCRRLMPHPLMPQGDRIQLRFGEPWNVRTLMAPAGAKTSQCAACASASCRAPSLGRGGGLQLPAWCRRCATPRASSGCDRDQRPPAPIVSFPWPAAAGAWWRDRYAGGVCWPWCPGEGFRRRLSGAYSGRTGALRRDAYRRDIGHQCGRF